MGEPSSCDDPSLTPANGSTFGVAISGGGARAALFAVGSLLYLMHSGLNRQVRLVSSVSGGSIVNAAIATSGDLSQINLVDFTKLMSKVSHRMSRKGIFFWPGIKWFLFVVAVFATWSPLYIAGMVLAGQFDGWSWRVFWLGEALYTGSMTVLVLGYAVLGRQHIQRAAYEAFIKDVAGVSGRPKLRDFAQSDVTHVLCATELTSGQPFYMSRDMLYCPAYGRARPDLSVAGAIYASAAFPVGFPPLRLKSKKLDLTGGWDDDPPQDLFLSDGGVFNNLGTETFAANDSAEQVFLPDDSLPEIPVVDRHLVVNASSPPKGVRISKLLVWRTVKTTARIMSVMYENTLRPRVQRLMEEQTRPHGPLVVDISESPIELIDRMLVGRSVDEADPVGLRLQGMRTLLMRVGTASDWKKYSDSAAATKTVLSAIGQPAALRLVRLGYIDTAVACHGHLGTLGVDCAPPESWFKEFVRGSLSEEEIRRPEWSVAEEEGTPGAQA